MPASVPTGTEEKSGYRSCPQLRFRPRHGIISTVTGEKGGDHAIWTIY